jgi:hypothetical protein
MQKKSAADSSRFGDAGTHPDLPLPLYSPDAPIETILR